MAASRWVVATVLVSLAAGPVGKLGTGPVVADEPAVEDRSRSDTAQDWSVSLPDDRRLQRQLEMAVGLAADERWSDAAALFDEVLDARGDAFTRVAGSAVTALSLKAEAWKALAELPRPGRQAYEVLFAGRAERRLEQAIAADDHDAVLAVARRWFHTPAGRRAAIIAAFTALENDQPAAATSWIERLAEARDSELPGPVLTSMREMAGRRTGDPEVADGEAAETAMHRRPREWSQPRGDAARNAIVQATRPVLVPRYRVPLTRHPEEAREFERRRLAAVGEFPPLPVVEPLAVDGLVLVHTPLGILAIDFTTGKRLWLRGIGASADPGVTSRAPDDANGEAVQLAIERAFGDATTAALASGEGLVFAVETPAAAYAGGRGDGIDIGGGGFFVPGARRVRAWQGGNLLHACDIAAGGAPRWRLPGDAASASASTRWFLGPPLVVGSQLFVLVEEKGEIRLDVLGAASGEVLWSQPLAQVDDEHDIAGEAARPRRFAGLSPALADGVLVCPLGTGVVVAIDIATRTLLWAYRYELVASVDGDDVVRRRSRLEPAGSPRTTRPSNSMPIIADGRVLLAPYDADALVCLDLRTGTPLWQEPVRGGSVVSGVEGDRVIVISLTALEARSLTTGRPIWKLPYDVIGGRPSGRGILTDRSLLQPLDSAEVVEVSLADGQIAGRCQARGGAVPGNLVAYRGEIISCSAETIDVFHQIDALESRIETVKRRQPDAPWALQWGGQMDLEAGRVADGLAKLGAAADASGFRLPPATMADAVVYGLRRDFAAAAPAWRAVLQLRDGGANQQPAAARAAIRAAVDGFATIGDLDSAWAAARELGEAFSLTEGTAGCGSLIVDPGDPELSVCERRWLEGRVADILQRADDRLREAIEASPHLPVRAASGNAGLATSAMAPWLSADTTPWPLGQVAVRSLSSRRESPVDPGRFRPLAVTVEAIPGIAPPSTRVTLDSHEGRVIVTDGVGRRLLEPLSIAPSGQRLGGFWMPPASRIDSVALGRFLFVHAGAGLMAFDLLGSSGDGRPLWTHAGRTSRMAEPPILPWIRGGGRGGGQPLGLQAVESDEPLVREPTRALRARPTGVVYQEAGVLVLLDPLDGTVQWERRRVPVVCDLLVDDEVVCLCTPDGRDSLVLSMHDGRIRARGTVPHRRQRLGASGRRILTAVAFDEARRGQRAETVRIEAVDPLTDQRLVLGEFSGWARAVVDPEGRVLVLEPDGTLTVGDGHGVHFRVRLPDMPERFDQLHVVPWNDRFLVVAGADQSTDAGGLGQPVTLHHLELTGELGPPLRGCLWAVDRATGESLWPTPATLDGHRLHLAQPPDTPALFLARRSSDKNDSRVDLLCLDKRTGHAVFDEVAVPLQPHAAAGWQVAADPNDGTIELMDVGAGRRWVVEFTGNPMPPKPPYQAASRRATAGTSGLRVRLLEQLQPLVRPAR
jgi:outer membrane protein assembly factor BamB